MAPIKSQKPKSGSSSSSTKSAKSSKHSKAKTHTPVGTAKTDANKKKKKKRTYTEEELGIPKLNMITPAGVQKPKGKKKGKVFVDDQVRVLLPPSAPPFP